MNLITMQDHNGRIFNTWKYSPGHIKKYGKMMDDRWKSWHEAHETIDDLTEKLRSKAWKV